MSAGIVAGRSHQMKRSTETAASREMEFKAALHRPASSALASSTGKMKWAGGFILPDRAAVAGVWFSTKRFAQSDGRFAPIVAGRSLRIDSS
jgi:hypothetical protein